MLVLPVPPETKGPLVCRGCPENVVLPVCQAPRVTEYVSLRSRRVPSILCLQPLLLLQLLAPRLLGLPRAKPEPRGWDARGRLCPLGTAPCCEL